MASDRLRAAINALRKLHGKPVLPPSKNAFELVLFENVAYLATPERRHAAFELLRQSIGTEPKAILSASRTQLERVTAHGILKERFAEKLRQCARIARDVFENRLDEVLDRSPAEARRALRRFPGIGVPGAERILLFTGRLKSLAPESNGLRVLTRLGVIDAESSYARSYAAGVAAGAALAQTTAALSQAHALLRHHGQTMCRAKAPLCGTCPLRPDCAYASQR